MLCCVVLCCVVLWAKYEQKQRKRRAAQIRKILGERLDLDGQINAKLYEILS